uniref:ATP synthase complex subunit 8 n=1 Tax=Scolytus schevyrewi TaxID=1158787 RepID=A0A6G6C914_9CUCU|nr:ATP synthase F0 subunit 8 [Scolytus schevyrewi]QID77589.1 ATP synthase F0 subunit 8 [Scolytus schevyrewi]
MPQMSPISWIMTFTAFSTIFLIMTILNYYMFMYKSTNHDINPRKNIPSWKW